MGVTLFALALFGCTDDGTACERLQAPARTFQTKAACTASLDSALDTEVARKAEAPTVYAQCLSSRQMASLGTGTVDLTRVNGVEFASAY